MLTVYGCPNTRSTRVVWALEDAGADYEYVRIDLRAGAGWKPEYLALNSGGKVPTSTAAARCPPWWTTASC